MVQRAYEHELEGIISKNSSASAESGRSKNWLKTKCRRIQEFVIGGYTLQENHSLAALLVGGYDDGKIKYAGRVGTGFNARVESQILKKLSPYKTTASPFEDLKINHQKIYWVKPIVIINVEFSNLTSAGILRHASFLGLRADKKAKDVNLKEASLKKVLKKNATGFHLTHPDKILFREAKISKQDLADYYDSIQNWILPFVSDRALSLLRCPNGQGQTCFFQKHVDSATVALFKIKLIAPLHGKKEEVTFIDSLAGIQELVQMGTLEIHVRGGPIGRPDYADLIVFDLDPDPGVSFEDVKYGALHLNKILTRLGLKSFVKTSGGKGLHIHVPIATIYTWDEIKNFSKSVCERMVKESPERYTVNILKKNRKGKIFLDYLRNGYGATAVATFSIRANAKAAVAFPISWKEVKKLKAPDQYTLKTVPQLLKKRRDPWSGYFKLQQKIKILDQSRTSS